MSLALLLAFLGTAFVVLVPLCLPLPRARLRFARQTTGSGNVSRPNGIGRDPSD
ncbi:MAG: hypothetical protein WBA25_19345 [Jannaschia sp.]